MELSACIKFATENPVTFIATAEGDQPRVRAFAMWFADPTGFSYHTGTPKNVCRQLKKIRRSSSASLNRARVPGP